MIRSVAVSKDNKMNERIRELAEQAGGIRYNDDNEEMTPMLIDKQLEKFAELIVKECIKIVGHTPMKQDRSWDYVEDCIAEACDDLASHFDIK
jgi:hypothetical protein